MLEENNLLKYKVRAHGLWRYYTLDLSPLLLVQCPHQVELLLDMLSASNADYLVMQKELDAARKNTTQPPRKQ